MHRRHWHPGMKCPCCNHRFSTRSAGRKHMMHRHSDEELQFHDEAGYEKCERCQQYVDNAKLEAHQRTKLCFDGNTRRHARAMEEAALTPPPTFHVEEAAVARVRQFRYLGRILSEDDMDLFACLRNIERATGKWAAVSKVLRREGASMKSFARFYLVIVSTVLLYGSATWVVTRRMEELLKGFHNRCLRHITRRQIRCTDEERNVWVTPSMTLVLACALQLNLHPVMYYVRQRRAGLLSRYVIRRPIYQQCLASTRITNFRFTIWNQPPPIE
jgi:hypothetical protein